MNGFVAFPQSDGDWRDITPVEDYGKRARFVDLERQLYCVIEPTSSTYVHIYTQSDGYRFVSSKPIAYNYIETIYRKIVEE